MTTTRTDVHSPGQIIPADYVLLALYSLPRGDEYDGWGLSELAEAAEKFPAAPEVVPGRNGYDSCTVCGSRYRDGGIFLHVPSQTHVYMGHECARKYAILADWSKLDLEVSRREKARAVVLKKLRNEKLRAEFLAANPGLAEALQVDHYLLRDLAFRFKSLCKLSEKQVALALKVAREHAEKLAARAAEVQVPAPVGSRVEFTGRVVSVKLYESDYGSAWKATVKVTTPAGVWLAWGTLPAAIIDQAHADGMGNAGLAAKLKGATVTLKATLKPGKEAHFALMSRPNGKVVEFAAPAPAPAPAPVVLPEVTPEVAAETARRAEQAAEFVRSCNRIHATLATEVPGVRATICGAALTGHHELTAVEFGKAEGLFDNLCPTCREGVETVKKLAPIAFESVGA